MVGQTSDDQTSGRKHTTINETKMGKKTIKRTLTDNIADNAPKGKTKKVMLLGVKATGAAKDAIQELRFVHAVTCGPPVGPGAEKLLRHRGWQRTREHPHVLEDSWRDLRSKLGVEATDAPQDRDGNVFGVERLEQETGEGTLEFELLARVFVGEGCLCRNGGGNC